MSSHPAEQHDAEDDDETPRPADRSDPIGEALANGSVFGGKQSGIAAGRAARGDIGKHPPLFFAKRVEVLGEEALGKFGGGAVIGSPYSRPSAVR